jgi:hypothetical protein
VTVTDGQYRIDEAWFGKTLEIRRVDDVGDVRVDSLPLYLSIPARPTPAPQNVTGVPESFKGLAIGSHTVTVTVSRADALPEWYDKTFEAKIFELRFSVNPAATPDGVSPGSVTTAATEDEDKDAGGDAPADGGAHIPFVDVAEADWFYGDVEYAYAQGLFNGTSENTFSPALPMTRAMFVTVVYRLAGSPDGGEAAMLHRFIEAVG